MMRTSREEIVNRLRTIMVENLEVQVQEQLNESDRLHEDLNIDSIMVLQLIVYIEENFGITVPEEAVDPTIFQTVGAVVTFIEDLQSAAV